MSTDISDYWSSPSGLYDYGKHVVDFRKSIAEDPREYRVVVLPSPGSWRKWKGSLRRNGFKGLVMVVGDLVSLSSSVESTDLPAYERLIACRIDSGKHESHRLLMVFNFTGEKRPYREIRERYTFCPICHKSSKDYGGKKHHYPSDGTWIRDVWNKFALNNDLAHDHLFLSAIYNLYCTSPDQRILVVEDESLRQNVNPATTPITVDSTSILRMNHQSFCKTNQRLLKGDCMEILPELAGRGERYNLIFVDPPYNLGKRYDSYDDRLSLGEYTEWCSRWQRLAYPLLEDHGMLVILNTPMNLILQLPKLMAHFNYIADVVWDDLAVPITGKMQATYYSLVFLGKKPIPVTGEGYRIRDPAYCKRATCKDDPHAFRIGISIWSDIHRTRQASRRWGHPCNLPEELVERAIEFAKNNLGRNSLEILDFFNGVGTTTMASLRTGCSSTGIEISQEYYETSKRRLDKSLFRNPDNGATRRTSHGVKRHIQKYVAARLAEMNRVGKGFTAKDQVGWLLRHHIITESDMREFTRPGEILKGVGKGGAPGETDSACQTRLPVG